MADIPNNRTSPFQQRRYDIRLKKNEQTLDFIREEAVTRATSLGINIPGAVTFNLTFAGNALTYAGNNLTFGA